MVDFQIFGLGFVVDLGFCGSFRVVVVEILGFGFEMGILSPR